MVDRAGSFNPSYGFRPELVPLNYEISPTNAEESPSSSDLFAQQTNIANESLNYVTKNVTFSNGASWQHCNINGPFPDRMVRGGIDSDGTIIYVGRAWHEGDMIPAKVIPDKNVAYVAWGGEEILKEDFEILRAGEFVWEFSHGGNVPEGAVTCGQTADGEALFVGRCLYQGTQTPGKVHPSHNCLYIPFDGAEVSIDTYEVLCLK